MRILALKADSGGCAKYRLHEPARVVSEKFDVDIRVSGSADVEATKDTRTGLVTVTEVQEDVDLIIFQRPLDNAMTSMIIQAQKQGIACIVEIDDDLSTVHPKNVAYRNLQPSTHSYSNYQWVQRAAELADLVTISTPNLAKFARHGRYSVLRNYVPESALSIEARVERTPTTVGWSGTVATHPTDLDVTRGRVGSALAGTDAEFFTVGDGQLVQQVLQLPDATQVGHSGWVPLDEYYQTLKDNVDVGIVPLDKGAFNESKSYLKGLEFAALGIPFVATPTSEYRYLEAHGIGVLAKTPGDWERYLSRWIVDPVSASRLGQRYREAVSKDFTYENHAMEWYIAWGDAIKRRKSI